MGNSRRTFMAVVTAFVWAGAGGGVRAQSGTPADVIGQFFAAYDAAFVARDLDALAKLYHPDVTIYEGGGVNTGWIDYRDHHLGPELKGFKDLKFSHSNIVVRPLGPEAAYVTSEYRIEYAGAAGPVVGGGLETDVMIRLNGAWVIRHTHTSARRQRPAGGLF